MPANESAGLAVREAEQQSADPETAEQINHTEEAAVPQAETDVESLCTGAEVGQTEPEQPSAFVQAVEASGILLENDSDIGVPVTEISPNEEKKISASVFRNDLRKAGEAMCKVIIKQLYDRNYITAEKLHILSKMPLNIAENTLDFLYRKGYLRRYEIEPHGDFYCVSPKLIKALTLHDAAKLVGVRQRPATEWGENAEVKASSIAARLVGGKLHMESVKRLLAQNKPEYTNIVMQPTEAGYSLVYPADKALPGDLNIVSFWEDTKECDFLLNEINGLLDEDYEIGRVIFAAFDAQKTAALAKLLMAEIGSRLGNASLYLYSFVDDAYYTYPEQQLIEEPEAYEKPNEAETDAPEAADDKAGMPTEEVIAAEKSVSEPKAELTTEESEIITEKPETVEALAAESVQSVPEKPLSIPESTLPAEDETVFRENIITLINAEQFYAAAAYARVQAERSSFNQLLYDQLAYALNDPLARCSYSTDNTFNLLKQRGVLEDALVLSSALRTFFSNQARYYDYQLKSFYTGINGYELLNKYPELSGVLYKLLDFKDRHRKGLDAYADYHSKTRVALEEEMLHLQHDAEDFYNNFINGRKKENASQKRFLKTKELIFAVNNNIGQCIRAVIDGDTDLQPLAVDFLQSNFYRENSVIAEDTIDSDMLWIYITDYWEQAGDQMMYRKHMSLMSHLRSNIISSTTKAIQLIARWCNLVERIGGYSEDAGGEEYRRIRQPILNGIDTTLSQMDEACAADTMTAEAEAGLRVLMYTLRELRGCIDGSGSEDGYRYFYAPFLLADHVMLDESFLPDLEMHSSALHLLDPMQRILKHSQEASATDNAAYRNRLHHLLNDSIDNYGTARLIVRYLTSQGDTAELENVSDAIDASESYARETADFDKKKFIGELELAQSYGQIDNSVEDKKEKILHIVNEWYDWAVATANYGFFRNITVGYLNEIRETAKSRETDLLEQLREFSESNTSALPVKKKKERIERIQAMIEAQNYTVAEDLLARKDMAEEDFETLHEENFLREFLDHYDDYYKPVATGSTTFSNLVKRTHNKEERGSKRLAEDWLPGGAPMGEARLRRLLTGLGFYVDSIKPQEDRYEQFLVRTAKMANGRRVHSTHPIAAFGSGAAENGFRVVCLNGLYDSTKLIDVMKHCGNTMHTLILLDCALTMTEHRRLARKAKTELGDKMFGVIDRTIMMFLVRNYDETRINRMLMALITPFAYYQPYVWESANVMPPEIFMGRRQDLERIESAPGVNIVYGGRQLGKSALLKKAKSDINNDENGNRAVLVDIMGQNYKQAARKVAYALYDEGVLSEELDTESWEELARAVKRRLQSDKNRIPYLLLLDEADVFIESCGEVGYSPFDALKDIQGIGVGRFKFVIAGLRNIVRFKRNTALSNNSVLTHLESMTVKPFTTSEARELLEIPLHYLGLEFPKKSESLITLILATTNYFPGLIQLYCAKLIGTMHSNDYANYSETNTPIYEVSEEHIKKVLADAEFNQQIREKYMITLQLDEDNYYYLIALLMASLYRRNGYSSGYSAEDIKQAGAELNITKIATLEDVKLEALMEELRELNVLRSTDEHHYLFTRFTFFLMMGTQNAVEDELLKYMEE